MSNILNIFTDGGARGNPGPAACACIIKDQHQISLFTKAQYLGSTTNNVAEYSGVLLALEWLKQNIHTLPVSIINFHLDSQLIASQITGIFKVKQDKLKDLNYKANNLLKEINPDNSIQISFKYIPRSQNSEADLLLNQLLDKTLR